MKRILLTLAALLLCAGLSAQNPIIRDQFTADPTARVFGGKVWLYPSHDIISPVEPERKWFCMEDYHAFSSEDLVHWTDHGVIVTQNSVPWVKPDSYSMWAPDCVEKDGKYYFYFPSAPRAGFGFAIGVAVADSPAGPFIPEPEPIQGIFGIDPCVLQASDGNAYIFWGNGNCAKLKPNMKELADDNPKRIVKWGDREMEIIGVNCLEGLPNRQAEGPFAFEYNGNYYLTYPYVRETTEVLGYAMSKNPMGPYEYKGTIMEKSVNECWTNHHSFVEYNGQWYLFYHHNDYSPTFDKNRSVRIDKVRFNPDGTIEQVVPTLRGVGVTPAAGPIQMDRYSGIYHVATGIDFLDPAKPFDGWFVHLGRPETWVRYDEIEFGDAAPSSVVFRIRCPENTRVMLQTRDGKSAGSFDLPAAGDWTEVRLPMETPVTGLQNIKLIVEQGRGLDLDWIAFE